MSTKVVISGAGGGIGINLVDQLLNEGCEVIAITRNALKVSTQKEKFGDLLKVIEIDFLQNNFIEILDTQKHEFHNVDILINNAGLLINKPFEEFSMVEIQKLISVNYSAALAITQNCIPGLKKSDRAHVVNISTMGAVQGSVKFPGLSIYASTKAAICTFTEVMAEEYKNEGIHFNCLALGSVDTDMFNHAFPGQHAASSPIEIAKFIVDFSLNKRELFNGKIIPVAAQTP
ncbi:MAG: short-chain dehydrogenase [Salinivirgaceae bacterium]|nr:MAG: short-chain dehydrogenase [Salinivirgaceae bacterium]